MQALEVWDKENLDRLEIESRPLANMAKYILQSLGAKSADTTWVNEFQLYKKAIEVRKIWPRKGCQVYLELEQKNLIPDWVEKIVDRQTIELAAR